ncbi:MAG: hypothetical protein JGK01_08040, partial [Microcoleus sp. PH2017_03_ELD_O_A]|nr:hypothetical protein [Microcoleus sp. PH2017_03_ELD_O_A]
VRSIARAANSPAATAAKLKKAIIEIRINIKLKHTQRILPKTASPAYSAKRNPIFLKIPGFWDDETWGKIDRGRS